MSRLARLLDCASEVTARLAAVLFCLIGLMLLYEAVGRYVFNSSTIWAEELSRVTQIWATYLAAAYLLKNNHLISVDILARYLGDFWRRVQRVAILLFILSFALVSFWYGSAIVLESIHVGRATATMLGTPNWLIEIAIPIGMLQLLLQCLVQIGRAVTGPLPPLAGEGLHP